MSTAPAESSSSSSQCRAEPPRRIALLSKPGREDSKTLCEDVREWLQTRGVLAFCRPFAPADTDLPEAVSDAEMVAVFGGDGTLVSAARALSGNPVPLLGVNFGRVGFLASIPPDKWRHAFASILDHGLLIERRMGLSYTLYRNGEPVTSGIAVNDIAVTRGAIARLASFGLGVNEEELGSLRADGLILSTPMGSTGYGASARGPILHPELDVFAVTAICPFLCNFLPLVLWGGSTFNVTAREAEPELFMTVDGQQVFPFREGDRLEATGAPGRVLLARPPDRDAAAGYFAKLRAAGFIGPA